MRSPVIDLFETLRRRFLALLTVVVATDNKFLVSLTARPESYHAKLVDRQWLTPASRGAGVIMAVAAFCLLAAAANLSVRYWQLQTWNANPDITHIGGTASFSTTDAPFFLSEARMVADPNGDLSEFRRLRTYPSNKDIPVDKVESDISDIHLLSVLIGTLSSSGEPVDLLSQAHRLTLAFAIATAILIVVAFGAAGYWLEGSVAAIGGGLSSAFLPRSSIGRIDTDQLNLGLMHLLVGLAVFAGTARTRRSSIAWCFAAGLCAYVFMWWYGKPHLIVLGACSLAWMLLVRWKNISITLVGTGIFLLVSGISLFNPFNTIYLQETRIGSTFFFPNILETITETAPVPLSQILVNATGSVEMGLVCLFGLGLFGIRHPAIFIAYSPLILFGLLNFVVGNRAIFYSAPILWFGAAFLMTSAGRFIANSLADGTQAARRHFIGGMSCAALAALVAFTNSPTNYLPKPTFPRPVLEGFASLRDTVDSSNSVVATWWDYGYASIFFNKLPTLHDGGSQSGPPTHFVARAFLDGDMTNAVGTLKFLSNSGRAGIAHKADLTALRSAFEEAVTEPSPDIYMVVTGQMAGWIGSISKIGNWDIEKGQPVSPRNNADGPQVHYRPLNCRFNDYPRALNCQGVEIDLQRGHLSGKPLLVGWTHVKDGSNLRSRSFGHDADHAIQIVQDKGRLNAFLLHRQLYESTFNKLYFQNLVEHPSITLHHDDYPHIRIYRIDGNPANRPPR